MTNSNNERRKMVKVREHRDFADYYQSLVDWYSKPNWELERYKYEKLRDKEIAEAERIEAQVLAILRDEVSE